MATNGHYAAAPRLFLTLLSRIVRVRTLHPETFTPIRFGFDARMSYEDAGAVFGWQRAGRPASRVGTYLWVWAEVNRLPHISLLLVARESGLPGSEWTPERYASVYEGILRHDWTLHPAPTEQAVRAAVARYTLLGLTV